MNDGIYQLHADAERLERKTRARARANYAAALDPETERHIRDAMTCAWSMIALGRKMLGNPADDPFGLALQLDGLHAEADTAAAALGHARRAIVRAA